jgi:putative flavoprotein involved in K+ transport
LARAEVVVVGGGPAGLSTAGALARRGIHAVVLEREEVGARWARRYDGLHLHTARRLSSLAHVPIPREEGRYVSKDGFARYLRAYVSRLGLDVRPGVDVSAVRRAGSLWEVETEDGAWHAKAVVLATGRYDSPFMPSWPGSDGYRGRLLHSAEYCSPREFAGASVLVVGIGNSGAEIAGELAAVGERVAVAVRRVPPISSREVFALPVQVLGIALAGLPAGAVDRVGAALRRGRNGDLTRYGLGPEEWGPFAARRPPVIDVGFLAQLKSGRIEVKPPVDSFTTTGVTTADGVSEDYDVVIAATGFRSRLPELLDVPGALDELGCPAGSVPRGLHFVGFRESVRGALFEISRDSRAVARQISAELERHGAGFALAVTRHGGIAVR